VNYQIKRYTQHAHLNFPIVGKTTGKHWVIAQGDQKVGDLLFSPHRSVYKSTEELYVIEPLHYNDHQSSLSEDEHNLTVFREGKPYGMGNLSTQFPTFRKAKFILKLQDKKLLLRGENKAFASPSLDTTIDSRKVEPQITASSKFLGTTGEFDCSGEINCGNEQWAEFIFCYVFFIEMDMIKTIIRSNK